MSVGNLWSELKRRRVFRVAIVYAVVGVGVAEALDLILPRLGVPDWVMTVFVVGLLAGFPRLGASLPRLDVLVDTKNVVRIPAGLQLHQALVAISVRLADP